MSFESDGISELTNETEELNNLFQRIESRFVKKPGEHEKKSVANRLKQAGGEFKTVEKKAALNALAGKEAFNDLTGVKRRQNDVEKEQVNGKQNILDFHKFASFSESSFVVSSFGDDDDEVLFDFITKKYPSPEKTRKLDDFQDYISPSPSSFGDIKSRKRKIATPLATRPEQQQDLENSVFCSTPSKKQTISKKKSGAEKQICGKQQICSDKQTEELIKFTSTPKYTSTPKVSSLLRTANNGDTSNDDDNNKDSIEEEFNLLFKQQDVAEDNEHEITEDDEEEEGEFGDYESYFRRKTRKQQKADETYVEWNKQRINFMNLIETPGEKRKQQTQPIIAESKVFKNCIIHVNGYTVPSINEIHKLVILNGGTFLHHMSRKSAVTHIVASKLTPRKHIEFRNYKVVKPEWIVDSVKENKLLDWRPYCIVYKRDYGQKELSFGKETSDGDNDYVNHSGLSNDKLPNSLEGNLIVDENTEQSNMTAVVQETPIPVGFSNHPLDSRNPNFLKYFFENSRLHHLSTWRSNLKTEYTIKSIEKYDGANSKESTLLFYLDFDCFFVRASSLKCPDVDFETLPMCVSHGTLTSDISSCNYVARAFGIRNGMWVRDAKKLCPELICLKYEFPTYESISRQFYEYLLGDVDVSCVLPLSVDECIIEVIFPSLERKHSIEKAEKIQQDIKRLTSCDVSIGIANNRILSRLALKQAKPRGIYYINSTEEDPRPFLQAHLFQELPGVGPSLAKKLTSVYFPEKSYKQLLISDIYEKHISVKQLSELFGTKMGTKIHNYLQGSDDYQSLIKYLRSDYHNHILNKESISIDVNWGIRFETYNQVDLFLYDLTTELVKRMAHYQKIGSLLTLKIMKKIPNTVTTKFLGMGQCELITKSSRIGLPTNDFGILLTEVKDLLKMVGVELPELRGVGVKISKLVDERKKKDFLPQQKLDFDNVKQPSNEISFLLPKDYHLDVFNNLPKEIQAEIKAQQKSEKLSKRFNEKHNVRKQESPTQNYIHQGKSPALARTAITINSQSDVSSLISTQELFLINNPLIDTAVYNELSTPVRTDLVNEWKKQEFIFKDKNEVDLKINLKMQKKLMKRKNSTQNKITSPQALLGRYCLNAFGRGMTNKGIANFSPDILSKQLCNNVKRLMKENPNTLHESWLVTLSHQLLKLHQYSKLGQVLKTVKVCADRELFCSPSNIMSVSTTPKLWNDVFIKLNKLASEKGLVIQT